MSEFPQIEDEDLRRLTDSEPVAYSAPDVTGCATCSSQFVALGYLIELLRELEESAISEPKQDAYIGLRNLVKSWRS